MELELKYLAPYLPYGLKVMYTHGNKVGEVNSLLDISNNDDIKIRMDYQDGEHIWMFKPILRPIGDLTKTINWGLQSYDFVSLFEIGDTDGCVYEFSHGNIKLLGDLNSISKHSSHHDINYLPYPVVQMMVKYHFDVFGLIPAGLAIDINQTNPSPSHLTA